MAARQIVPRMRNEGSPNRCPKGHDGGCRVDMLDSDMRFSGVYEKAERSEELLLWTIRRTLSYDTELVLVLGPPSSVILEHLCCIKSIMEVMHVAG